MNKLYKTLSDWRLRVLKTWRRLFGSYIVWITDDRRTLVGRVSSRWALVAIIGREHLVEHKYVFRNAKKLEAVRAIRPTSERGLVSFSLCSNGDMVVIRHVLSASLDPASIKAIFWVPESCLLAKTLDSGGVAQVSRNRLSYFLEASGATLMSGGVIQSLEIFAWSVGAPSADAVEVAGADGVVLRMRQALSKAAISDWWFWRAGILGQVVRTHGKPIAILLAVICLTYFSLVSAYLKSAIFWHEQRLSKLGPSVETLLKHQREIDENIKEAQVLSEVLRSDLYSYAVWSVIHEAWSMKASITGIDYEDGRVTLRGKSPRSTELLSRLSTLPVVTDAKFIAAVRQVENLEEFSIAFELRVQSKP